MHPLVEVPELGVPVGVTRPLQPLAVGLQAVPQIVEQLRYQAMARPVAHAVQLFGELPHALAGPTERRVRVAAGNRLDQALQIPEQGWVFGDRLLAATACLANASPSPSRPLRLGKLLDPFSDDLPGHPGRPGHGRSPSPAQDKRFRCGHQPPRSLVQDRAKELESSLDGVVVNHDTSIHPRP